MSSYFLSKHWRLMSCREAVNASCINVWLCLLVLRRTCYRSLPSCWPFLYMHLVIYSKFFLAVLMWDIGKKYWYPEASVEQCRLGGWGRCGSQMLNFDAWLASNAWFWQILHLTFLVLIMHSKCGWSTMKRLHLKRFWVGWTVFSPRYGIQSLH